MRSNSSRVAVVVTAGVLAFAGLTACQDRAACASGDETRVVARPPGGGGRPAPRPAPPRHRVDVDAPDGGVPAGGGQGCDRRE